MFFIRLIFTAYVASLVTWEGQFDSCILPDLIGKIIGFYRIRWRFVGILVKRCWQEVVGCAEVSKWSGILLQYWNSALFEIRQCPVWIWYQGLWQFPTNSHRINMLRLTWEVNESIEVTVIDLQLVCQILSFLNQKQGLFKSWCFLYSVVYRNNAVWR